MATVLANPTNQQQLARRRQRRNHLFIMLGLIALAVVWLVPMIWTFSASLRTEASIQSDLTRLVPVPFTLENYQSILGSSQLGRWFVNSLIVAVVRTVLQLMICSLAAYAFARIKFPGRNILFPFVLVGLMVPGEATLIPVYLLFSNLKLLNTYTALIVPGIASSFAVFLLVQFFRNIPVELEEAAMLDGASRLGVYFRIFLPLSTPVLTTLSIFTFLGTWNDFLWPLMVATDPQIMTITVGLRNLTATVDRIQFAQTMAAAWAAGLPIVVFFLIFQQRIISGIQVSSGIK